jgi:hypothetical protein
MNFRMTAHQKVVIMQSFNHKDKLSDNI